MAKKEEGKIQDCWQCGEEITCRSVEYQGNTTLQWQNDDGKAHYKFVSEGNYECRTSTYDEIKTTTITVPAGKSNVVEHGHLQNIAETQKLETSRLRGKLKGLLKSDTMNPNGPVYTVIKMYVETLEMCDDMCITDEIKRGMIFNNVIRRSVKG